MNRSTTVAPAGTAGAALRTIRTAAELSLSAVAEQCSMSASTIARIERGERDLFPWERASLTSAIVDAAGAR
ncbi:helix-turn-helix transcriptional regulator [Mumia zhuanghuii]|uniref:Helix-turn-helix domain-containing protein n=2 Tax=Mumia TaxID=1546255 RepID=A0ABW1QQ12_9ACTN|nr:MULTISPECIES: helix-turn-helix transcriptional regulator [Mumia]KAA1422513.1 helix-turn-helix transcriptional regulator [Mumia zhuanghuii]